MQYMTPRDYAKIEIANQQGLDKLDWSDRIQWVDNNNADLESFTDKAESPAQYHVAVCNWRAIQSGQPTNATVSLDATASGLALIGLMMGDKKTAELTNVVFTGSRRDAYTDIHAATELDAVVRKDCKNAVMQSAYGGSVKAEEVYGDDIEVFYDTLDTVAPSILRFVDMTQHWWNPHVDTFGWTMPDGFDVDVPVMTQETHSTTFMGKPLSVIQTVQAPVKFSKKMSATIIHSVDGFIVRELLTRCNHTNIKVRHDPVVLKQLNQLEEMTGFKSARKMFYDPTAKDEFILPEQGFKILPVHDSFRTHVIHAHEMRKQYNQLMFELAESKLLEHIADQLGYKMRPKSHQNWHSEILDAEYAMC